MSATPRAALLALADLIDRGPGIPLHPSVFSALAREAAEDYADDATPTERAAKAEIPAEPPSSGVPGSPGGALGPEIAAQGRRVDDLVTALQRSIDQARAARRRADNAPCPTCGGDRLRADHTGSGRCHAGTPPRTEDVLPGPRATIGLGAPIDPATAPAVCPARFITGSCRCCVTVEVLRDIGTQQLARILELATALDVEADRVDQCRGDGATETDNRVIDQAIRLHREHARQIRGAAQP